MDVEEAMDGRRKSADSIPSKEKVMSKSRPRRPSVAGPPLGGSTEKKRNYYGKQRRYENEKRQMQKKKANFYIEERKIDPLNLMGISRKEGHNSPKVDSPLVGDRGVNFDPDNLRPVDLTDPLKLNNLEDDVLAVKVNAHKRKRKRRRRRTYSENDKDHRGAYDSTGHEMDTETSENEFQSPVKAKRVMEPEHGKEACSKDLKAVLEKPRAEADTIVEEMENDKGGHKENCLKKIEKESLKNKPAEKRKHHGKGSQGASEQNAKKPSRQFREKDQRFQYGNYSKYYGYRNPSMSEDDRIEYMKQEWFEGKDCLDIGCNVGHLTLYIARHFNPGSMKGIDIDENLIRSAKSNIRHYISLKDPQAPKESDFPTSFPICLGPLAAPSIKEEGGKSFGFPYNITFKAENYVDCDWESLLKLEQNYDFILCMSVTKWIQLNWGDDGVKKLFKKIYLSLRPGGKLLLEPQPWRSYGKKKNLTQTTRANFDAIKFKPDQYIQFLLSNEVGFATSEKLGVPKHKAQGFQRPIYLLTKGGSTTNEATVSNQAKDDVPKET